ncbi:HD-GYP domain-containing protein [Mesobacillus thioparans]|uniref:HD-GYP domain-containing protein n=1 Tax=Mesobacillus thioparans TaxID=370439 RepID=UPI0039EE7AA6
MQIKARDTSLNYEEIRAIGWFMALFYGISIVYDFFYYFVYAKYVLNLAPGLPGAFGYWYYLVMLLLIPLAFYLKKNNRTSSIKFVFIISFVILSIINDGVTYWGNTLDYASGNVVEVFLILFSPIFVNTRFFFVVFGGMLFKYLFIGFMLQTSEVLFPIVLVLVLSGIAYTVLLRFQGYVKAMKTSYDKQLEGIVKGVIATIELKDPYTKGHSERVAQYARTLAKSTGMYSSEELESFFYACLLHDIGKVNIPDHILMKPGKLTKEEYDVIKKHPEVGAEAIMKVDGLGESIEIIKSHHERWDGKGYPEQLSGEGIPFLARVVSIADAFDAMTSSRSYRSAMPVGEAYNRIIDGAGTQFDPQLVVLFKEIFSTWVECHDKYQRSADTPLPSPTYRFVKEEVTI